MNDSNLNSNSHQESPFKGKTGIKRLMNAFGYSLDGFKAAFKHEDAFRQEVFLACLSAVEAVVDRVSIERHELAKRAKDIGSAAVFIALLNTVVMWGLVLIG
ncbi:MAG: diacylglycerol kinase [Methylophilales bacterium 28-44-11]|nr:MAG: diacylglycerol kinase [Methylophilales bacterium 28-44-11]